MPTNPATLERQCVPIRTGAAAVDANCRVWNSRNAQSDAQDTQPAPAEASTEVGADEPQAPGRWLWRVVFGVTVAVALAGATVLLFALSPFAGKSQ